VLEIAPVPVTLPPARTTRRSRWFRSRSTRASHAFASGNLVARACTTQDSNAVTAAAAGRDGSYDVIVVTGALPVVPEALRTQ